MFKSEEYFKTLPSISAKSFNCPHCNVVSHHNWYLTSLTSLSSSVKTPKQLLEQENSGLVRTLDEAIEANLDLRHVSVTLPKVQVHPLHLFPFFVSKCDNCEEYVLWVYKDIVHPQTVKRNLHEDLPKDVKDICTEAAAVATLSPVCAAALLRTAIEKLCKHLGYKERSLKATISRMKKENVLDDTLLYEAMESVRLVGNEAVHEGVIQFDDDAHAVGTLFAIVNHVVEKLIGYPKRVKKTAQRCLPGR